MKNYLKDDPRDWLLGLLPDLITEVIGQLGAGFIYSPYIPLQVTAPMLDPAQFTIRKSFKVKTVRTDYFKSVSIDDLTERPSMDKIEEPKVVAAFKAIMNSLEGFMEKHPTQVPEGFSTVKKSLQKGLVGQVLKELTAIGTLVYQHDPKGWWRPEVLDALASIGEATPAPSEEQLTLGPSGLRTSSPSGDDRPEPRISPAMFCLGRLGGASP